MIVRWLWLALGWIAVGLAIAGAALPLLPTTPFLLVAAYAFARSSKRFHTWLMEHKHFGPLIRNWREHGAIDPWSKFWSMIAIGLTFGLSVALQLSPSILIIQAITLSAVTYFILTRPNGPKGGA